MEEKELLRIGSTGKTILQEMLSNGQNPGCENYDKKISLDIILKTKRYDILPYVSIRNLLRKKSLNETYIDYILNLFKTNKEIINISLFDPFEKKASVNEIVSLYIKYAKEDLLGYLPGLTKENLLMESNGKNPLFKNRRLIEILLDKNKKLALDKIITKELKEDFDIAIILNMNDVTQELVSLDFISKRLSEKYIEKYNEKYKTMYHELSPELQAIINRLYAVFMTDDPSAVETMIYSYVEQLKNNDPELVIREIEQLINMKQNTNFTLHSGDESYFYATKNELCVSNKIVSSFNHEVGHALLHNLTNAEVDDNFYSIINRCYNDPMFIENVALFSENYYNLLHRTSKVTAQEYYKEYYNIKSDTQVDKIQEFLDTQRHIKIREYMKKGYSRETLEIILDNSFTVGEFIEQHRKIQRSELKMAIMRTQADIFMSVADIIDAVSRGHFSAGKLKDISGNRIRPCAGHGLFYYNVEKSLVFDEIMANYSTIIKSPRSEEGIYWLRKCLGDELLSFISNYYNNIMLASNNYHYKDGEDRGRH